MLASAWRALSVALHLLTRVPVRSNFTPSDADYGRSVLAYPLVGLLVGGLLIVAQLGLSSTAVTLQAALLLTLWVTLTGALHLDGLADCVDAWVGGYGDRQRSLSILKDPASGPMAVSALILTLLLKFGALTVLLTENPPWWLIVPPLLGRTALVAAFLFIPYARADGLGAPQARSLPRYLALSVLLGAYSFVLLAGWPGVLAVMSALGVFFLVRRAAMHRLSGFTGDVAGALCELTETAVLIILALFIGNT